MTGLPWSTTSGPFFLAELNLCPPGVDYDNLQQHYHKAGSTPWADSGKGVRQMMAPVGMEDQTTVGTRASLMMTGN